MDHAALIAELEAIKSSHHWTDEAGHSRKGYVLDDDMLREIIAARGG